MTVLVSFTLCATDWNVGWDGNMTGGPVRLKVFKHVERQPTADNPSRYETVYAVDCLCDSAEQARAIALELGFIRPL